MKKKQAKALRFAANIIEKNEGRADIMHEGIPTGHKVNHYRRMKRLATKTKLPPDQTAKLYVESK